jgi:hypothetical protein
MTRPIAAAAIGWIDIGLKDSADNFPAYTLAGQGCGQASIYWHFDQLFRAAVMDVPQGRE